MYTKNQKMEICQYMYDNNLSLGKVNKEHPISRTRLYDFIRHDLPYLDRELYDGLKHQLSQRNKRGGESDG